MLEVMGIDRAIAVDLQRPGQSHEACFFSSKVPVETLETVMAGVEYFATQVHFKNPVVVLSPNSECLPKAQKFELGLKKWLPEIQTSLAAYVEGGTASPNHASNTEQHLVSQLVGDVEGADVIIVDDMIDTCETLLRLTELVKSKGAKHVYCFASHALLENDTEHRIDDSAVEQVVIMDTIPAKAKVFHTEKIKRLSVAPMLAELIQAEHFKAHSYIDKESTSEDYTLKNL